MTERRLRTWIRQVARHIAGAWLLAFCLVNTGWARPIPSDAPDAVTTTPGAAVLAATGPGVSPASILSIPPALPVAGVRPAMLFPSGSEVRSWDLFTPDSSAIDAAHPRPFVIRSFGDRLMARMEREARRRANETLLTITPDDGAPDSILEEERAYHAEQIIGRALNRSLDEQLEQVARTAWGLAPAFDWLEDFGHGRRSAGRESTNPVNPSAGPGAARGFDGSVGVRIGAHPRLVLRGVFRGLSARIDVPILEDEIRLSVERPLGPHGRAALVGAFPRGEPGRAFLSFNFNF